MALRGIKPTAVQKRFKAFFYGDAGAGKTTAAIQFPAPYLIDTEKGAENDQYVKLLNEKGGAIFQTVDFDELVTEIKSLLTEKHHYKTLVIDPLTTIYNDLLDKCAARLKSAAKEKDATGTEFGRHYGEANKEMKRLMQLLVRLDMNVIITSHAKKEYGDNFVVLGNTFDCYKKLDYLFDLVIEIQKRGKERYGVVKKSRIEAFAELESFKFDFNEVAKRYGFDTIEREAEQEILANKEQVARLKQLIKVLAVPEDVSDKWLTKAQASSFDEMSEKHILACIKLLEDKIKPGNEEAA